MNRLVMIRHGESEWNRLNLFTGWTDVDLTDKGIAEARAAGKILKVENYRFDIVYTSFLKRAIKTMWLVLEEMGCEWLPVIKSWRLNERHYGALQGLNKVETARKYGEEQVQIWRRSYDVRPPALARTDERYPGNDARYRELSENELPLTECLKDNLERTQPFWEATIRPALLSGKKVLIVAHGNSIRALVKILARVPDAEITALNIPTGIPLIYELDDHLKPLRNYYLGDQEEVRRALEAVKNQGKIK